ncbi:hypothetical protein GPECTOR_21g615 [Gonium pectorale]|uniref:Uncharacterized protein n=1 Tax=Gonium pectorale TaxID=33097 RepID=A0A150GHW0_GONPE|nr:hypothetical protein GPECTOR_21g615 [Gonium pectorale]|eukprot:KXZ49389.1 hypothetical protein GPECTOR_21g615 [Gonium pectorale]
MTHDLEVLIRKRVADRRCGDVVRVLAPPLGTKTEVLELDDFKFKAGLGQLYERELIRRVCTMPSGG